LNCPIGAPRILLVGFITVEIAVPHYEFLYRDCQKFFDKILAFVDYEEGEVICSHCGSKNVGNGGLPSQLASKKSA